MSNGDKWQTRCKGILRGAQFGWNDFADRETNETKRTPQIVGRFEMLDGEDAGKLETWFGSLSDDLTTKGDKSFYEFTIESLRACGWTGDELAEIPALAEAGHLVNEVILVREHKIDGQGKTRSSVKYVNRLGAVKVDLKDNAMTAQEIADFSRKMKARLSGGNGSKSTPQPARSAAPPPRRTGRGFAGPSSDYDDRDPPPYDPNDVPY